jgi:hypothetical protein
MKPQGSPTFGDFDENGDESVARQSLKIGRNVVM